MKKVFKLEYDYNNDHLTDYDSIFWYGDKVPTLAQVANDLEASASISADVFLDKALEYFKNTGILLEEEIENINTIEDIDYNLYVMDMHINAIVNNFNFSFATVGGSPWSYVLYYSDWDISIVDDLYNGYSFYNISEYIINDDGSLDYKGTIYDCYLPSDKDVVDFIYCHFDVSSDWGLWDNEEVEYSKLPKMQVVKEISYKVQD